MLDKGLRAEYSEGRTKWTVLLAALALLYIASRLYALLRLPVFVDEATLDNDFGDHGNLLWLFATDSEIGGQDHGGVGGGRCLALQARVADSLVIRKGWHRPFGPVKKKSRRII